MAGSLSRTLTRSLHESDNVTDRHSLKELIHIHAFSHTHTHFQMYLETTTQAQMHATTTAPIYTNPPITTFSAYFVVFFVCKTTALLLLSQK